MYERYEILISDMNYEGGGGGVVKGSTFMLDTKARMTRVHGKGITVDLEVRFIISLRFSDDLFIF